MPIYEYKCENCGEVFEVRQKYSDEPVTVHEKCGGQVEKLISAPSFQFKGSGWYVNDYGKGGNGGKKGESEGGGASESAKSKTEAGTKSDGATKSSDGATKSSETKTSDSSSSSSGSTTKSSKSE